MLTYNCHSLEFLLFHGYPCHHVVSQIVSPFYSSYASVATPPLMPTAHSTLPYTSSSFMISTQILMVITETVLNYTAPTHYRMFIRLFAKPEFALITPRHTSSRLRSSSLMACHAAVQVTIHLGQVVFRHS